MAGSPEQNTKPNKGNFKVLDLGDSPLGKGVHLQWDNTMFERMHTCLFGDTVGLANKDEAVKQEGIIFMDEQTAHKFGINNCAIGHICKHE
eukprot:2448996-Ditylum_brightwellii.AAC.1